MALDKDRGEDLVKKVFVHILLCALLSAPVFGLTINTPENQISNAPHEDAISNDAISPGTTISNAMTDEIIASKRETNNKPSITNMVLDDNLSNELSRLTGVIANYVNSLPDETDEKRGILDFVSKLALLIGTILSCLGAYKALTTRPFFNKHREAIILISALLIFSALFYLLSGLVVSIVYIALAIIIVLSVLLLSSVYLLNFIDEKYPESKINLIDYFAEVVEGKSIKKLAKRNLSLIEDWLNSVILHQQIYNEPKLELSGSFVKGYNKTIFEIMPDESVVSHWKKIDNKMLIPIQVRITVVNTPDKPSAEAVVNTPDKPSAEAVVNTPDKPSAETVVNTPYENLAEIVNIQYGVVVVGEHKEWVFKGIDYKGFQDIGAEFLKTNKEKLKETNKEHEKINNQLEALNLKMP
jgi:hypothetical protein